MWSISSRAWATTASLPPSALPGHDLTVCTDFFRRGHFPQAVACWDGAARRFESEQQFKAQSIALTRLSWAYQALGQNQKALASLEAALKVSKTLEDPFEIASVLGSLGNAYVAIGPPEKAEEYFRQALSQARSLGSPGFALAANILNNWGNLLMSQHKPDDALKAYSESGHLAKKAGNRGLMARALGNAAKASRQAEQPEASKALLDEAWQQTQGMEASHDKAYELINIGLGYDRLRSLLLSSRYSLLRLAFEAFNEALKVAQVINDLRAESYARGYLGHLYEAEHRHEEARQLTYQAILAAQQVHAPESLYRWQWQMGRLLKELKGIEAAITEYQHAVETLQGIRGELLHRYGGIRTSFRDTIGPVYFELVDLLLQHAVILQERDQPYASYLHEARKTIELFKAAEIRDYFGDECVEAALAKVKPLDIVSQRTMIVYPIPLPNRLELLVSLPTGLQRFMQPIKRDELEAVVKGFRWKLEMDDWRYLYDAQDLYDWLIRPLETALQAFPIDTLVFVPDGVLRTIPMAALHDGEQYLIEKYPLATTPSLDLTDPRPMNRQNMRLLAAGLTQLPNVSLEIETLRGLYNKIEVLLDEDFSLSSMEKALRIQPLRVLHIASHAQFAPDVNQSFIRTFDHHLTMDRLERQVRRFRFRDDPLELLTLSACQTALGDDRAALGLAGVAIKAGARSALATLWLVHDRAAAILVGEFYKQLTYPTVSRAKALQCAQLKLLKHPQFRNPFYWAPFLLINSWL